MMIIMQEGLPVGEAGLVSVASDPSTFLKDSRRDVEAGAVPSDNTRDTEQEILIVNGKSAHLNGKESAAVFKDEASFAYTETSPRLESILKESRINRVLWIRKLLLLAIIFSVSLSVIYALFHSLHRTQSKEVLLSQGRVSLDAGLAEDAEVERQHDELLFHFPKNLEQLKEIRAALEVYQKEHRRQVQVGIICLYLFLQTFMIPGSIFLNLLAGSLYGFYEALFLVLVLAGAGSSLCYCLSSYILKEIVYFYFPERCEWLAREVHRHRHHMLNYILFLRLTPILPNWFINVSSPLVGVPYRDFVVGTTVGLMPASVVGVKAGVILSSINSMSDLYNRWTIATMSAIAVLVMLPVIIKRRYDRIRGPILIKTI